jgi:Protein of unknown function (DUF3891)
MLVSRRDGWLLLVEQNEHGRLCGEICAHWGNARFAAPTRSTSARVAAAMHDEGWREADDEPLFNAQQGRPLHFLEIEMSEHVPLYRRGVERVSRLDPYAGLLVSMHWTGLYRNRWGLQGGGVFRSAGAGEAARLQDEAVAEQEQQWLERKCELMLGEPRSDFEIGLWHNYDVLQAFDLLSLYACTASLAPAAGEPAKPLTDVLKEIEAAPGPRVIGAVPERPGGNRADLVLAPTGDDAVSVDPHPLDQDALELVVRARRIPDRRYESGAALRTALDQAERVTFVCRFTSR